MLDLSCVKKRSGLDGWTPKLSDHHAGWRVTKIRWHPRCSTFQSTSGTNNPGNRFFWSHKHSTVGFHGTAFHGDGTDGVIISCNTGPSVPCIRPGSHIRARPYRASVLVPVYVPVRTVHRLGLSGRYPKNEARLSVRASSSRYGRVFPCIR